MAPALYRALVQLVESGSRYPYMAPVNKIYDPAKYIEQMKAEEEARKLKRKKAQQRIAEEKRAEKESEKAANKGKKQLKDKEDIPGDNN